jgi:hypothetical protein
MKKVALYYCSLPFRLCVTTPPRQFHNTLHKATFKLSNRINSVLKLSSWKTVLFLGLFTACQSIDTPQQPTPAKPITVTGIARAIDGRLSPNTQVILEQPDKTTLTATTDATGSFKLENVKPPYNLTVFSSAAKRTSLEYQGLNLPNPTVIVPETLVTHILGQHSATVSGAISAGPVDPNATTSLDDLNDPSLITKLAFASSNGDGQTRASDPTAYSLKVSWHDAFETSGALHVLRWRQDSSSGLPTAYLASGAASDSERGCEHKAVWKLREWFSSRYT